jgi:hypothetical protein
MINASDCKTALAMVLVPQVDLLRLGYTRLVSSQRLVHACLLLADDPVQRRCCSLAGLDKFLAMANFAVKTTQ